MTAYNPAEVERLIAEAREDDANLIADCAASRPDATGAMARMRRNARAMADQLEAAHERITMTTDKKPRYEADDVTTWSLNGLLANLDAYRERLAKEEHEVVRTTVQLEIDRIIAKLDRRNREAMAVS